MLAPILSTDDPYGAAASFSAAGWKVESDQRGQHQRASVSLAHARVILIPTTDRTAAMHSRGDGVVFQLHVPPHELSGLFLLHRAVGVAVTDLFRRPTGERGFEAEIVGYRFLILGGDPDPDLALIGTDPRITALADGLRQRDGAASLTESALALSEGAGESIRTLRQAVAGGLRERDRKGVGDALAEVVIAAAVLARQLGVDLDGAVTDRLGRSVT